MKQLLSVLGFLLCGLSGIAQAPQAFNYQGIARDGDGAPLINTNVSLRIAILHGSSSGAVEYQETHNLQTNRLGIFNVEVGRGILQSGVFDDIDWGAGEHYVQIEMDPSGSTNYTLLGESQILSVPYALYAGGEDFWKENTRGIHYLDGNVGIGTNDPSSKLTIEGDDPILEGRNYIRLFNKSMSNRSNVYISLSAGDDQYSTYLNHNSESYDLDGFSYADFGQLESRGGGLNLVAHHANGMLRFFTDHDQSSNLPIERMRLASNGHLGIGTKNPTSKLTIEGDDPTGNARSYLKINNLSLSNRSIAWLQLSAGEPNSLTMLQHCSETYDFDTDKYTDFGQVLSTGRGLIVRASAEDGIIKFLLGQDEMNSSVERMRLTNDGNLGVGTEAPVSRIHVANGDVYIENISNGVIMKSPNGDCWRMTINDDGSMKTTSIPCPN